MSDEFFRVAQHEIQAELDRLEQVIIGCSNDLHIFQNSKQIEEHLHKIKGLAPMMGQEMVGEVAKTADAVIKYIIDHGSLTGSYEFILETIENMKDLFSGQRSTNLSDLRKKAREMFPQISSL
jgi:chemotaxis protein histidine kinase CheA